MIHVCCIVFCFTVIQYVFQIVIGSVMLLYYIFIIQIVLRHVVLLYLIFIILCYSSIVQ